MYDHGEEIPYCRRLNETQQLDRNRSQCENEGVKLSFLNLLEQGIKPSNVLDWSSSVEINDLYAAFFFNRSLIENHNDPFICNCTMLGTFGKYCEYQWTNEAKSFSDAIKTQFEIKEADDDHLWNTQRYGKILCYETLPCNTGDLCLDWREICDGVQRCSSGIDEENWDKLEFNECEDNEFRCTNGMCIAEEFWLDGDHDCMDWSDEVFREQGETCPFDADSFKCDEHLCPYTMYSCGDGQCVLWTSRMAFQRFAETSDNCLSGRNINYMCEANPYRSAWTLESGLCSVDEGYDDPRYLPWNMIDSSRLTENEKCQYLFRCTLSDGFERDCPCNSHNCTALMMKVCPKDSQYSHHVLYPPKGLIDGNLLFFHDFNRSGESLNVEPLVFFYGNIKCPEYQLITNTPVGVDFIPDVLLNPRINHELCNWRLSSEGLIDSSSTFQYDKFCWNESLTFNGQPYAVNPDACPYERQCISQYRIRDGSGDCLVYEDEEIDTEINYCTGNVGRYRFQCFNDEHQCLSLFFVGTGYAQCSNEYDESWYGLDHSFLRTRMCYRGDTRDCDRWKEYIQQSSSKNSSNNTLLDISKQNTSSDPISFRSYCDSFWDLEGHLDELNSSCQHWTCQSHQYQCQTGQCINFAWVCDGEWDCADASDEEAIVLIQKWSIHNSRFEDLNERVEKCRTRYFQSTFSEICNTSFEFGCYQAKVANPLDIRLYRPCINLTQIGDGVENCYNAYDEKNTFAVNSEQMTMLGFHFTCKNNTFSYTDGCDSVKENNCTEILCPNHRNDLGRCSGIRDVRCLESDQCERNARCNGERDCIHGEDEYWCASGTIHDQVFYRSRKRMSSIRDIEQIVLDSKFPLAPITLSDNEQAGVTLINHTENPFRIMHSYQCNRGVSILQMNETICLCPPAYYGHWCEFFSDRISIIANGYYGEECSLYESTCDSYCSANSLCRRADANSQGRKVNLYCVCSLDHFGPRCYLKFDDCDSNPCLNNGTCSLTMDRSATASYMCACSQQFYGNRCEQEKPAVRVTLNMNNTSFVRGTVVQLYRVERLTLVIQHAKVHHGLPSTVYYEHSNRYAPYIGVLKMYEDFANPKYLIMYVLHQRVINITSSPKYCPQALLLLSECEFFDKRTFAIDRDFCL
ncbi:unnamed protein product [Adineta steineri]|uniref:EGF-like domain-containing protein n=1 Tax=Adineta steineri TaxID=433720 RepID=A0A819M7D8_9BILA|nr:unnamed protein product [Adineta steineri]CAF3975404.1 unnamed protein product [Adineta steineri]